MVTWDIRQATPSFFATLSSVLGTGAVNSISTSSFAITKNGATVLFDGTFVVNQLGMLTAGTITGFHVYSDGVLLLDGAGHAIGVNNFLDGTVASNQAIFLLYDDPITLNGSAGNDVTGGGPANDRIFGNDGDDKLYGQDGDDLVSGGAGADTLFGTGGGEDTVDYSEKVDAIVVTLNGLNDVIVTVGGVAEDHILDFEHVNGGSGDDRITGDDHANRLAGNGGNDTLDGGLGADTLIGGLGNDTYFLDNAGDTVIEAAGEGTDAVHASLSITLGDNVDSLVLLGASGFDGTGNDLANTILGNTGDNTLSGLGGNDTLDGGSGADTLIGGLGDDTSIVDDPGDIVTEVANEGADTVLTSISYALGAEVEHLTLLGATALDAVGNGLANTLIGNAGDNLLSGLDGDDALDGGVGDDLLAAGFGLDLLTGGEGSDTFVFDAKLAKTNVDHITDFTIGVDHIGLDAGIFKKVNDDGFLKKKFFADGEADDSNYIVYKEKNGKLFYDRDGDGDAKAKLVAVLDGSPDGMSASDFLILA